MKRLQIVPNFSEGRRVAVVDALVAAYAEQPGVRVLDREMDANHNRCVITAVGDAEALIEATISACRVALREIDLRSHRGEHPRIGAMDVVPFLPIEGTTMEEAIAAAHRLGERLWQDLEVPVYYYEEASLGPVRRLLPDIRRGNFEGLREMVATDPARRPDVGGPLLHESFGAAVIGARRPLVAFNVELRTQDMAIAKAIAKAVRESSGGLRNVRAIAVDTTSNGTVQVSMNLVNTVETPIFRAFEFVEREAQQHGVQIESAEIVGLVPLDAMLAAAARALHLKGFTRSQVLEVRLMDEGADR